MQKFLSAALDSLTKKAIDYVDSKRALKRVDEFALPSGITQLESRDMLSVSVVIDYSYDSEGFFDDQSRRDAIEEVAADISLTLGDSLDAITPGGGNSWSAGFFHPGTGDYGTYATNLNVAADEIIVFAGGRDLGGSLGVGGPGGWSASGNSTWYQLLRERGETGVANDTDFAPWGGSVAFDENTNWNFDSSLPSFSEYDFRSVAYHELYHVFGFGISDSFDALINSSNQFTGAKTVAEHDAGGPVPLNATQGHFDYGTMESGQEAAMDPDIANGQRKYPTALDLAALDDIGWDIVTPAIGSVTVSGNDLYVNGTIDDNLIEVRNATGGLRILVNGYDHGIFATPTGLLFVDSLAGNDEIRLQPTVNVESMLDGGTGNDLIRGGAGVDTMFGNTGVDLLYGRDGNDILFGDEGNDKLFGMNGNDQLNGGAGNDNLTGGPGSDTLRGDDGNDTLLGSGDNDFLYGDAGDDTVNGGSGDDFLRGNGGDDHIIGLSGVDRIYGDGGDDTIIGGPGNDLLYGGNHDDDIYGSGGIDTVYAGAGNDTVYGEQSNDILFGEAGNDFLYGGTSPDQIDGGSGVDYIDGEGGNDTLLGGTGNDEIRGGTGIDEVRGGDGNDVLLGGGGNDDLYGELGNDTLTGGTALDLLDGGAGTDTAIDTGERGEISIENS